MTDKCKCAAMKFNEPVFPVYFVPHKVRLFHQDEACPTSYRNTAEISAGYYLFYPLDSMAGVI